MSTGIDQALTMLGALAGALGVLKHVHERHHPAVHEDRRQVRDRARGHRWARVLGQQQHVRRLDSQAWMVPQAGCQDNDRSATLFRWSIRRYLTDSKN